MCILSYFAIKYFFSLVKNSAPHGGLPITQSNPPLSIISPKPAFLEFQSKGVITSRSLSVIWGGGRPPPSPFLPQTLPSGISRKGVFMFSFFGWEGGGGGPPPPKKKKRVNLKPPLT